MQNTYVSEQNAFAFANEIREMCRKLDLANKTQRSSNTSRTEDAARVEDVY